MDACSFPEIECSPPKVFLKNVKRLKYELLCSQARPKESHPFLNRSIALCMQMHAHKMMFQQWRRKNIAT